MDAWIQHLASGSLSSQRQPQNGNFRNGSTRTGKAGSESRPPLPSLTCASSCEHPDQLIRKPAASAPFVSFSQQQVVRHAVSPTFKELSAPLPQKQHGPTHSFPFFFNGTNRETSAMSSRKLLQEIACLAPARAAMPQSTQPCLPCPTVQTWTYPATPRLACLAMHYPARPCSAFRAMPAVPRLTSPYHTRPMDP